MGKCVSLKFSLAPHFSAVIDRYDLKLTVSTVSLETVETVYGSKEHLSPPG
jgi:hypothetical protein